MYLNYKKFIIKKEKPKKKLLEIKDNNFLGELLRNKSK